MTALPPVNTAGPCTDVTCIAPFDHVGRCTYAVADPVSRRVFVLTNADYSRLPCTGQLLIELTGSGLTVAHRPVPQASWGPPVAAQERAS